MSSLSRQTPSSAVSPGHLCPGQIPNQESSPSLLGQQPCHSLPGRPTPPINTGVFQEVGKASTPAGLSQPAPRGPATVSQGASHSSFLPTVVCFQRQWLTNQTSQAQGMSTEP